MASSSGVDVDDSGSGQRKRKYDGSGVRKQKQRGVSFADDLTGGELSDAQAIKMSRRGDLDAATLRDQQDVETGDIDGAEKKDWKSKHTLESDEEDDEKYERLDMDNIEGQEDDTVEYSGDTKITPFNMKDEMEEGHFDSTGTFIFKKGGADIQDAWLDGIDWTRVKKHAGDQWHKESAPADDEDGDETAAGGGLDRRPIYEQLLTLLNAGETITKALRRLGGRKDAATVRKERWKAKKAAAAAAASATAEVPKASADDDATMTPVLVLSGLVDRLVSDGDFEAYGHTYEKIRFDLDRLNNVQKFVATAERGAAAERTVNDELDMFAETIDEGELARVDKSNDADKDGVDAEKASSAKGVQWEFRWTNTEDAELHGPCSTEQMIKWQEENYFKDAGVWVRRVDVPDAAFYSSRRIDFELYDV